MESLTGYGDIFERNVRFSGVIPQISLIMGPCAGGAVYSPAITDFVMMVKESSYMYITGPDIVKAELNEDVTHDELGGWRVHTRKSGACHLAHDTELECLAATRRLLSFLPANNTEKAPHKFTRDPANRQIPMLNNIVPEDPYLPYEMKFVINSVCDSFEFFEIMPEYAKNIIVGFGRVNGDTVGFVAN
jgi:propionyl-CoA carboxylase beta chain